MSEEQLKIAERKKIIETSLNELYEQGYGYAEVRSYLSSSWKEWKDTHVAPRIRIINSPRSNHVHSTHDGEMGTSDLRKKEKLIDIPFEELSPRAQRLYLDALKQIQA